MTFQRSWAVLLILAVLAFGRTPALAAPEPLGILAEGTHGVDVTAMQRMLAELGYAVGPLDGDFGVRTRNALLAFQADRGLPQLGTADPVTLRALEQAHSQAHGFLHAVVEGETLRSVAAAYGTPTETLRWINLLRDTGLVPGQLLLVPGRAEAVLAGAFSGQPAKLSGGEETAAAEAAADGSRPADQSGKAPGGAEGEAAAAQAAPLPTRAEGPIVLGYYAEDWEGDRDSLNSLQEADGLVDMVVNFQMTLDETGGISTLSYPHLLAEARTQGASVQGLVHNLAGDWFDKNTARAVLSDPQVRARTVDNLVAVALEQGLSGINVDIENVPPDQRQNYTAFVRTLSGALRANGLELTLSIPGKTWDDPRSAWAGAFDYRALGQYADWVVPMAYDEHTLGYSAGPVASYEWVEQVAAYATSQMPPEKVLLGVAAYGYDWEQGSTRGRGLSAEGALSLAARYGETVRWDAAARVPYFTYERDGVDRIVYFEDARSTAYKLDLVAEYGLGGIAVWRLGLEDPGIWPVIAAKLR